MKVVLKEGAYLPERAHKLDAGMDLRTPVSVCLPAEGSVTIDTGVAVEIPEGFVGFLKAKSGLNVNFGITGEGVIDAEYTGTIKVKLYNHSRVSHFFARGDKIIQLVVLPCLLEDAEQVESLADTERGTGGFGSTGR